MAVAVILTLSIGVGVLITEEGVRRPLHADQVASANGIYDFTWSPDGKFIAYATYALGRSDIWVIPSTGGSARRLTNTQFSKKQLRWSKDGAWIAFVAVTQGETRDIFVVSADGQTLVAITDSPADEANPAWSPSSEELAFTETSGARGRILSYNLQNRTVRPLAEVPASDLQWSPDGKSLAFVSDPLQPRDDRRENQDIFLVPATGGVPHLLTAGTPRFRDSSPSWAPDSRYITYASEETGHSNIYILDTETGTRRALATGTVDFLSPPWSTRGKNIAHLRNENALFHVFISAVEDGRMTRVSDRDGVNGGFEDEDSSPRGFVQWSPDGARLAFTHSDPSRVSDIWVAKLDGSRPIQLTNMMPPELRSETRFVWPEPLKYRSFDGEEVAALVFKPRGAKPRSGHPALLVFRDTVDGQHAASWDPFIQFFTSEGYLVFAPNVRGSSGRGRDYRQLVFGHGGDHDVRDAFFGLDRLSSEGLIDTERLGVFGAGTGGFLATAALIRDEARFKAAVCLYGIIDTVTAASYPGMGAWTRYMIGATPMENPATYYERSLVNFVDKLRAPIIFLNPGHSALSPFQQLQQFAVQAEVKGKWYDYKTFENESGGWQYWHESNLRLALEAMDALFEKHLLGREREIRLTRNR